MKTLFQRLKPEIKNKLLSEQSEFPTLIGDLLKTLNENVSSNRNEVRRFNISVLNLHQLC